MKHALPLAILALFATGCAEHVTANYPSLLPRPIESRSDEEPVVTPDTATPDSALESRLAEFKASIGRVAAAFAPAADRAERAARAAKGDSAGTERWVGAQTALAELDGYRADTSAILTDLEQLAIARAADVKPSYPALEAVRATAEAQLAAQTARIAAIQAMLPQS
jgi:hypothetical protein